MVRHLVGDDQMVLRLDSTLHVVTDDARLFARRGHGTQRHLRLAGTIHTSFDSAECTRFFPVMGELLDRACHTRLDWMNTGFADDFVRAIEFGHIPVDGCIDLAQTPVQLLPREALRLGVDGFELAAVDCDDAGVQKIDVAAEGDELRAHLANGGTIVTTEIGDRLEVRCQSSGQPDELQVPPALALEATRGLDLVEIAVDVDLEDRCRMVTGTARLFWNDTVEAERCEIKRIDEGIDYASRVVIANVVVNRLRQERRLRPIRSLDEPSHPLLPHLLARIVQCFGRWGAFSHRLWRLRTLPKSGGDPGSQVSRERTLSALRLFERGDARTCFRSSRSDALYGHSTRVGGTDEKRAGIWVLCDLCVSHYIRPDYPKELFDDFPSVPFARLAPTALWGASQCPTRFQAASA